MRDADLWRWRCLAALVVVGMCGMLWAADPPAAATVDLKFIENPEGSSSWYGFGRGPDGTIKRPFGKPGRFLLLKVEDGKVHVDTNGDGKLDTAVEAKLNAREGVRVHILSEVAGRQVKYPLDIRVAEWGVLTGSAAALEGTFGGYTITIFDRNIDGRFGSDGDGLRIQRMGQADSSLPWSRAVTIDRQIYQLELTGEGAQLKLNPYTGPVAEVKFEAPDTFLNLQVTVAEANNAQLAQVHGSDTALLIPGKYRIRGLSAQVGPPGGYNYLSAYHDYNAPPPLDLQAGQNTIKVGSPLVMGFAGKLTGATLELEDVKITGVAGEMYRPHVNTPGGDIFAVYIKSNGQERELGKLEFG
jgi:hypothetical protein